jgi:predicted RNase H-like HicB family nuclease
MRREHVINAMWDADAAVWVATSEDVPGLVTESKTFEALLKKLRTLVPELLELNDAMPKSGKASYRVVAERHEISHAAE